MILSMSSPGIRAYYVIVIIGIFKQDIFDKVL